MKLRALKEILRGPAALIMRPVATFLHRIGMMRPAIYVHMDGGLASQMHFYLVGERLKSRHNAELIFDLSWYDEWGMDMNNRIPRNFDLLKLSPQLPFHGVHRSVKLSLYRLLYKHANSYDSPAHEWERLRAPVYLDGYYAPPSGFYDGMREVFRIAPADLTEKDRQIAAKMKSASDAVGMHVRRGDLSQEVYSYGTPATDEYFRNAVKLFQERYGDDTPIFIFSDEPDWVRQHLMRHMPAGNYRIVDHNGSDRGYIDLWLMSQCRHFIASKGSFGRFAALLSDRRGDLTLCDSPESRSWLIHIPDAILL